MPRSLVSILAAMLAFASAAHAEFVLFTVTTTADTNDGACNADCSLREAIIAANAANGFDYISFAIPSEGGVVTITPSSPLPAITSPLLIDGETQLGGNCAALLPAVEIDGSSAGLGANGLVLDVGSDGSVIRGLAIGGFAGDGILVASNSGGIACNIIGADATGTVARANATGVAVTGSNTEIGGAGANQISGNVGAGIAVAGGNGTKVLRNVIGAPEGGSPTLANGGSGVLIDSASDCVVGAEGAGNTFRSNGAGGVWVSGNASQRDRISRNAMTGNGGEGIDLLGADFEDPIDPGDPDEGPNRLQNSPSIASATHDAGANELSVAYRVDTLPANAAYPLTVEFFRTDDGDEGAALLGTDVYDTTDQATGTPVSVTFTPAATIAAGQSIVATATDALGNTSEFPAFPTQVVPEPGALAAGLAAALALAARRRRVSERAERSAS